MLRKWVCGGCSGARVLFHVLHAMAKSELLSKKSELSCFTAYYLYSISRGRNLRSSKVKQCCDCSNGGTIEEISSIIENYNVALNLPNLLPGPDTKRLCVNSPTFSQSSFDNSPQFYCVFRRPTFLERWRCHRGKFCVEKEESFGRSIGKRLYNFTCNSNENSLKPVSV